MCNSKFETRGIQSMETLEEKSVAVKIFLSNICSTYEGNLATCDSSIEC